MTEDLSVVANPRIGRKPPKAKRTLAGTVAERSVIMAPMEERLPEVGRYESMGPEALEDVLRFIGCGGTVGQWARLAGLSASTVRVWLWRHAKDRVEKAREAGCEALAEEVLRVVTTPSVQEDVVETTDAEGRVTVTKKRGDAVYARKLAAWGMLELMKSWSPSKFGNRVAVDVQGTFAAAVTAARGRIASVGASEAGGDAPRLSPPAGDGGDAYPDLLT